MINVIDNSFIMVIIAPNKRRVYGSKRVFISPQNTIQKQYEVLRAFYAGGCSAEEAARRFGYKITSFYSLTRDFKKNLSLKSPAQFFFISRKAGRKPQDVTGEINRLIISLRKNIFQFRTLKPFSMFKVTKFLKSMYTTS